MTNQLEVRNVSIHYGDLKAAVNISLALKSGEIGCLLGPSGCGKTSLLRAIAGFEAIARGEISLQGEVISAEGYSLAPEKRRVGMVFQDFALFPHLDIADNISFGLQALSRAEKQARVNELLKLVDLEAKAKCLPHELSGGQQQRVALARALAPRPNILLLDEPFSSLDAELREQLAVEVRQLLKREGITAILVTHDQHEAFAMADQITLLQSGRLIQTDTPYNLYHRPKTAFAAEFIGMGEIITVAVDAEGRLEHGLGNINRNKASSQPITNSRVKLLIRPDDIVYRQSSSIALTVLNKSFRGANFLYQLQLPDGQILPSLVPSHIDLDIGSLMPVGFDLQDLVIFD